MSAMASADKSAEEVEATFCFAVEWFDSQAQIVRKYSLYYFVVDDTIEMFDLKNRRTFLKRCSYPSIRLSDLFIGATLTVYARQLKVMDYGDAFTRSKFSTSNTRSLMIIKPESYPIMGKIIDQIYAYGFQISSLKMMKMTQAQAQEFYGDRGPTDRTNQLASGPVIAIEVVGANPVETLGFLAQFGQQTAEEPGPCYMSSSERSADTERKFLFENPLLETTAQFNHCTVCVLRPHIVNAGKVGMVVDKILEKGYEISAMQMFFLDKEAASEFMEVYKTVLPEYNPVVEHMVSGPCIAMEIRGPGDVVSDFRKFCGPADPEIARSIRKDSLRALFGEDKIMNGVHCTDLSEDGVLETEFFFNILQKQNNFKTRASTSMR